MKLSFIRLRGHNPRKLVEFYEAIGAIFTKKDGKTKYTADIGGVIFEISHLSNQWETTMGVTLGFDVPDLNKACKSLEQHGVLTQPATDDESGRYAVFTDPEGHKVKITESSR